MTDNQNTIRYCVIFQLDTAAGLGGVRATAPGLIKLVERWAKGEMEQLCRSKDGELFGYLFRSSKPLAIIKSEFDSASFTSNADSMILFEVGDQFTGIGFSRAWTWLQHH